MKRKHIIILVALALVIALTVAVVHMSLPARFICNAIVVDELPVPQGELLFTAYDETDRFYARLSVFRGEVRDVAGEQVEHLQVLWNVEPRGRTRLHRYEFEGGPGGSHMMLASEAGAYRMYVVRDARNATSLQILMQAHPNVLGLMIEITPSLLIRFPTGQVFEAFQHSFWFRTGELT